MKDLFISQESQLEQHSKDIAQFWTSMTKGYLPVTSNAYRCFYAYAEPVSAKCAVFLCQGRIESAHKYQELLWELYNNGYAVFTLDHLGQGQSERLVSNPHVGFIDDFSHYVAGLEQYFEQMIKPKYGSKVIMLGHSMGGAIASLFLQKNPEACLGAFFSAPMFDIHTHGTPKLVVKYLAKLMCQFGLATHYALGQGDYSPVPFNENELTHSERRYKDFRRLYNEYPKLQLGGVSYGWIHAAFKAMQTLTSNPISIPVTIASAGADTIVDSNAHQAIKTVWPHAQVSVIAGAKHELLNESDAYRVPTLNLFYRFSDSLLEQPT